LKFKGQRVFSKFRADSGDKGVLGVCFNRWPVFSVKNGNFEVARYPKTSSESKPGQAFGYPRRLLIFALLLRQKARIDMKKGIHPEYKEVVFWDTSSDHKFISRSTQAPKETIKMEDGKEYPVIKVEVSSASHPFFTGKKLFVDTAGRVEKFKNKYQKKA
jgi:large subunit ribosomal protein L31